MASQKSFKELQFSKLHFFLASDSPKRVLLQALVEYKLLNFHKMIDIKWGDISTAIKGVIELLWVMKSHKIR